VGSCVVCLGVRTYLVINQPCGTALERTKRQWWLLSSTDTLCKKFLAYFAWYYFIHLTYLW
jgi:hypothetical protein